VLTCQLLICHKPFPLILFIQVTPLPFARSILPGLVNLSFDDLVVDIVHPVVVGPVTGLPMGVIPALGLIIVGTMASVVITVSRVIVPVLLVIWLTIVAFVLGVVVTIVPLFPVVAKGLSWCMAVAALPSVAVKAMIHGGPVDTYCMIVPHRRPITRYPDMIGVPDDIVAFYPDIVFIWAFRTGIFVICTPPHPYLSERREIRS
jgi:hypothetical protein